jgi:protein CpxP
MSRSFNTTRLLAAAGFAFAFALLSAPAVQAQEMAGEETPAIYASDFDLDAEMATMTKELSLTEDQQAKIEPILISAAENGQEIRAMYDDEDNDEAVKKLKALHKKTMGQIEAVLNKEQAEKFEAMVKADMEQVKKQAEAQEEDMD